MFNQREYNTRWKREWRKENREQHLVYALAASARHRGLEFALTSDDIVIPEQCPVLNIPLFFSEQKKTDNTPSVDRRDNDRGYTKDNIFVTSWRFNRLKSDATLEELVLIGKWAEGVLADKSR